MATTILLSDSINFAMCFLGFKQLTIGTANQPALTAANIVLQTILGNPFIWDWNRSTLAYAITANAQDVTVASPTFGNIEKAAYLSGAVPVTATSSTSTVVTYTAANTFKANQPVTIVGTTNGSGVFNLINGLILAASGTQFTVSLANSGFGSAVETNAYAASGAASEISNIADVLGAGTEIGSPNVIAAQTDDNSGNIGFRVLPSADQVYIIQVTFQKRAGLLTGTSSSWSPVPDHFSYIYQNGFLAWMLAYALDSRWQTFNQKFIATLLAAAEGVTAEEKNQFLEMWTASMGTAQAMGARRQQGVAGLGAQ